MDETEREIQKLEEEIARVEAQNRALEQNIIKLRLQLTEKDHQQILFRALRQHKA